MKTPGVQVKLFLALMLTTLMSLPVPAEQAIAKEPSFVQSAYLWTQATDTDLSGSGDWGMYKDWLGVSQLRAESDPGGWGSWADTAEGWNNNHWGDQQTRYGTRVLPDILLGIGTMPYDPTPGATWEQKLTWEDRQWQLEAKNDPTVMQHFVSLGNHLVDWHYKFRVCRQSPQTQRRDPRTERSPDCGRMGIVAGCGGRAGRGRRRPLLHSTHVRLDDLA